ncbi:hypothetical protein [Sphingobacterium paludis]|jgi:hypothetical protein|uniref:Uncharacterized protein n=1 Tax=Sphingobacterium paludis TaxID=1476465 RepID=A0A4R7D899_9SPHI|nr:hypothetical protein [Sphingobacterium paludis]TDS17469.1 hypothetical protein B0I21_101335 [Sphingobacterium paludis]
MDRMELVKTGESILTTTVLDGLYRASYWLVSYREKIVGVALYHNSNKHCTLALVSDKNGEKQMLGHFRDGYPVPDKEFYELHKIYDWAFQK